MLASAETRMQAIGGGVLILLGVPAYYLLRREGTPTTTIEPPTDA